MHKCVNNILTSAKLTWRWIQYLGWFFPLMVVVPVPFPQGLPTCLSWMKNPWTRAPLQSAQKGEIAKSPRPAAQQSHTPQQSQAGRVSTGGKSVLKQRCFANTGCKSPLLQDPTTCFGDISPSTSATWLDKSTPALQGGRSEAEHGVSETSGEV